MQALVALTAVIAVVMVIAVVVALAVAVLTDVTVAIVVASKHLAEPALAALTVIACGKPAEPALAAVAAYRSERICKCFNNQRKFAYWTLALVTVAIFPFEAGIAYETCADRAFIALALVAVALIALVTALAKAVYNRKENAEEAGAIFYLARRTNLKEVFEIAEHIIHAGFANKSLDYAYSALAAEEDLVALSTLLAALNVAHVRYVDDVSVDGQIKPRSEGSSHKAGVEELYSYLDLISYRCSSQKGIAGCCAVVRRVAIKEVKITSAARS